MPRRKPDKVLIHRIEFGGKEREDIERFLFTKSVDNLVRPVALLGIGAGTLYGSYQLKRWIDSLGNIPDKIEAWFIEKGAAAAEKSGDFASTIVDPTGKQKEVTGYTFGEKANIAFRVFAQRLGFDW